MNGLTAATPAVEILAGSGMSALSRAMGAGVDAHPERIGVLSGIVARRLGLAEEKARRIEAASVLHDIGKVGIDKTILNKPGPLDEREWVLMRKHTVIGWRLLDGPPSPLLRCARQIALHHHERWDGSGYPHTLAGERIPLAARIVMLCDQYDALRSLRPYKEPWDHETTRRILLEGNERTRPEHFDPRLLELFRSIHPELEAAWETAP